MTPPMTPSVTALSSICKPLTLHTAEDYPVWRQPGLGSANPQPYTHNGRLHLQRPCDSPVLDLRTLTRPLYTHTRLQRRCVTARSCICEPWPLLQRLIEQKNFVAKNALKTKKWSRSLLVMKKKKKRLIKQKNFLKKAVRKKKRAMKKTNAYWKTRQKNNGPKEERVQEESG